MKKVRTKLLFLIFLLLLMLSQRSYSEVKVKTIVIFFSLNEAVPAYQSILEGFHANFPEYFGEPCNLLIEYLDVVRSSDEDYLKHIVNLYNEKFDAKKFDLIITVGPWTYSLLEKNGLAALKSTPTIAIDLDKINADKQNRTAYDNVFEINVKLKIKKTIKHAFDLFPNHKDVYVISGSSAVDHYYAILTRQAAQAFTGNYNFIYVSGISLDSTLQIVQRIPENSIVMIPSYMTDVNNAPISTTFALNNIANQCKVPLFTVSDNFIKKGGIGGLVFSFKSVGRETSRLSGEILNGRPIKDLVINEDVFFEYMYDWKELKRWDLLNSKVIPSGSIYINKEFDFISEYRWRILGIILFMIFQTSLLIYTYRIYKRQKKVARQKEELELIRQQLIREDRLSKMAELTASLSHELNQPLTAILYNAQAGMRFLNSGKLDQSQAKEILGNIIEDNKRAGGIISSIRSLMTPESREMEVVDLSLLIEETVKIFNFEATQHHIKIRLILEESLAFVHGDKIQLQQVILNFLSNALLAMDSTDPSKRLIKIVELKNTDKVTVSVKDSGVGIKSDILENIFKPFVTTRKNGFGIGLAISKSIIERHQGKIWAENVEEGGAKFSFSLKSI